MASIQILPIAFLAAPEGLTGLTPASFGALAYLGVMCAGVVYFLYMALIRSAGAVFASMTNYLVPAIGVLIGATFNAERVSSYTWMALIIILFSIALNQMATLRPIKEAE